MCGRFTQSSRKEVYEKLYGVPCPFEREPRFNVAPSQEVLALRVEQGKRKFALLSWGLLPHWARDPESVQRPINARAETVGERPSFRDAFRRHRALVPAEIFYEWIRKRGEAVPFAFKNHGGEPFSFAAIWECWQRSGATPIESLSLIVGPANERVAPIHDRMPVIISAAHFDEWLDPVTPFARLKELVMINGAVQMDCFRVSEAVNNPRNEGPQLIVPWAGSP